MRKFTLYTLCLVAVISAMWGTPPPVYAANANINYVPLAPIDVTGSEVTSKSYNDALGDCQAPTCFPRYLRTIYNIGIVLAGLFAVVSIVRGGFTLMFTDSILGRSEGKSIILRALGGLVIVYSSYILMNMINPALGRDLDLALQFPHIPKVQDPTPLTVVTAADALAKALDDIRINQDKTQTEAKALEGTAKDLRLEAENPDLIPAQKEALLQQAVTAEAQAGALRDYNVAKDTVLKAKVNGNVFIANLTDTSMETLAQAQSELDGLQSSLNAIDGTLTKHLKTIADASTLDKDPAHASLYTNWATELKTQANAAKQEMKEKLGAAAEIAFRYKPLARENLKPLIRAINWGTTW